MSSLLPARRCPAQYLDEQVDALRARFPNLWVQTDVRVGPAASELLDIVDTAVAAGQFSTLARALQAAGLVDTLKGPGPFTVFAPTDAAFAKVPEATLTALLADPARLRAVLTYHVVQGRVLAADVLQLQSAGSVQGEPIRIAVTGGTVRLNGSSTVTRTDITAANGVIHVLDTVLMPPSMTTLPQTAGAVAALPAPPLALGGAAVLGALALKPAARALATQTVDRR
uniref:FAS1 domain-containing protein n=1 Tax=uncultured Armatimonadetes bacterium TaxID=157466 RepID=A0A6J4INN0_9BACT|nr:hypothetical protein AVDCRST_MAG63-2099 [uncultured Armatimonadetes bacterium]